MFYLTYQERKILLLIGVLIFIGAVIRFVYFKDNFVQQPTIDSVVNNQDGVLSGDNLLQSMVNINKASRQRLEDIPGVGKVIAQRIIDYRKIHGPFNSWEDLIKVNGIGLKKIRIIQTHISF